MREMRTMSPSVAPVMYRRNPYPRRLATLLSMSPGRDERQRWHQWPGLRADRRCLARRREGWMRNRGVKGRVLVMPSSSVTTRRWDWVARIVGWADTVETMLASAGDEVGIGDQGILLVREVDVSCR